MKTPRSDRCYAAGVRARKLDETRAIAAWRHLSESLIDLGDHPLPKFENLLRAIRSATISVRQQSNKGA